MELRRWVRVKSRRAAAARAAARMLRSRLQALALYLPLAAAKSQENVEYVHQLRVWSRRSDAAVDLCRKLIPKRQRRKLQRRLKLIRQAAATARDADVLREMADRLKPGLAREKLLAIAQRRRSAAQGPILAACQKLDGGRKLLDQLKAITARLKRRSSERPYSRRFDRWARRQLRPLIVHFFKQGRKDLADIEALHQFRIAGKRLRYAMELVAGAFDAAFRKKLYRSLARLQSQLGAINDAANLVAALEQALTDAKKRPLQAQIRRVLARERKLLVATRQEWVESWTRKRAKRWHNRFKRMD